MVLRLIPRLIPIAALVFGVACNTDEPTSTAGPETDSNNESNPPPADLNDDLSCTLEQIIGPKAVGTLTNHSSETSTYTISVGFLDEADTRVASATAFVNNVQAGQTAAWEAIAFDEVRFVRCEIVSVDRFAS